MKIALVHDYLTEFGGAERVLEALYEIWPSAPIYTSLFDKEKFKTQNSKLKTKVQTSKLQEFPLASKLTKAFTFFYPLLFENMDLREYDVVISDGTIWSKGVLTTPEQLHIHYCHTPPRWLYGYPGETDRRRLWYLKPILKPLDNWLRVWDFESAQRPDYIVANSKTVARRIRKFWRREAEVIYPPVGVNAHSGPASLTQGPTTLRSTSGGPPGRSLTQDPSFANCFLVVSRLSAYKNVDLAIEACNQLNLPLVVVGMGREEERLKALAGKTVKFMDFAEEKELLKLYKDCKALIFPVSEEDFGIVPVEAMAHGKPVIALRSGGVTETVIGGKTGVFFDEPTVASLTKAIEQFDQLAISSDDCVKQAQKFSKKRFQREFRQFVGEKYRDRID